MTGKLLKAISIAAVGVFVVSTVLGQNSRVISAAGDKYVISAKAGGVNYVDGRVVTTRREGRSGQLLKGDDLEIGDIVSTGADGRAEILLNPGSYMRIGRETEFSFVSTSLDDLRIKLTSGSAVFEIIADNDFNVEVIAPKGSINMVKSGVYRIDVLPDGAANVSVWKGTALAGRSKTEVNSGRTASVTSEASIAAKFDRDDKDDLDTWSKQRAKELTKINAGLQRKVLRDSLINSFNGRRWNMYDSFGLWVFDPMRSFWCFMPFGYGWGSPYGFGYGYDFWSIGMPHWIYYAPPPISTPPNSGGVPPKTVPVPNNGDTHGRLRTTPPYLKIENSGSGAGDAVIRRGSRSVRGAEDPSSFPSRMPSSSPIRIEPVNTNPAGSESRAPRGKP